MKERKKIILRSIVYKKKSIKILSKYENPKKCAKWMCPLVKKEENYILL